MKDAEIAQYARGESAQLTVLQGVTLQEIRLAFHLVDLYIVRGDKVLTLGRKLLTFEEFSVTMNV